MASVTPNASRPNGDDGLDLAERLDHLKAEADRIDAKIDELAGRLGVSTVVDTIPCGCSFEHYGKTAHDWLLLHEERGVDAVIEMLTMVEAWNEIDFDDRIPPFEWSQFAHEHSWERGPATVRLLDMLTNAYGEQRRRREAEAFVGIITAAVDGHQRFGSLARSRS